jgi:hypothetical protein
LLNTAEAIRDYLKNYPEKFHESMIEKHLKNLTFIELPTDDEIDYAETQMPMNTFELGAKWMRDKIQGGEQ